LLKLDPRGGLRDGRVSNVADLARAVVLIVENPVPVANGLGAERQNRQGERQP
jgi:hypothetical protein